MKGDSVVVPEFMPEGMLINTRSNFQALSSLSAIREAAEKGLILEARVLSCDTERSLHVDMRAAEGIIPRSEGAWVPDGGEIKDIALISRVGKSVCFIAEETEKDGFGKTRVKLSRKKAQQAADKKYISRLRPGDVIPARVSRCESYGAFCDIGCGISALLPARNVSVSRIPHTSSRFFVGQDIKCIVKSRDERGRPVLSLKELLGTWEENAALFSVGETVVGIVRSVESYGIFVELTPNLTGLAEYGENISEGMIAAVYIKNIIPEKHKIKLTVVDAFPGKPEIKPLKYFFGGNYFPLD